MKRSGEGSTCRKILKIEREYEFPRHQHSWNLGESFAVADDVTQESSDKGIEVVESKSRDFKKKVKQEMPIENNDIKYTSLLGAIPKTESSEEEVESKSRDFKKNLKIKGEMPDDINDIKYSSLLGAIPKTEPSDEGVEVESKSRDFKKKTKQEMPVEINDTGKNTSLLGAISKSAIETVSNTPQNMPMLGHQYTMGQASHPFYGTYDRQFQASTSMTGRDPGMSSVAYTADGNYSRTESNASSVSTTLSHSQASTQAHSQTFLNPAATLPPDYSYFARRMMPGFARRMMTGGIHRYEPPFLPVRPATNTYGATTETQFQRANAYGSHSYSSGVKPYACPKAGCNKRFTTHSSLYRHRVVHTHSKPYMCSVCSKTYSQASTLAKHIQTSHGIVDSSENETDSNVDEFTDSSENETASDVEEFTDNIRQIPTKAPPRTNNKERSEGKAKKSKVQPATNTNGATTDTEFQKANAYGSHSYSSGKKPYACAEAGCDKQFTTYSSLCKHYVVHSKPYICSVCSKTYKQASTLAKHTRTSHGIVDFSEKETASNVDEFTGKKPYACTQAGCNKRFTTFSSLYKHYVVHTKPYICSVCSKTYKQASTLAKHARTSHGIVDFSEKETASNVDEFTDNISQIPTKAPLRTNSKERSEGTAKTSKIGREYEFPRHQQSWNLRESFAVADDASLASYGVTEPGCPVLLRSKDSKSHSLLASASLRLQTNISQEFSDEGIEILEVVESKSRDFKQKAKQEMTIENNDIKYSSLLGAIPKAESSEEEVESKSRDFKKNLKIKQEMPVEINDIKKYTSLLGAIPKTESRVSIDEDVEIVESKSKDFEKKVKQEMPIESEYHKACEAEFGKKADYHNLLALHEDNLVANMEKFECPVCFSDVEIGEGVTLHECLHSFCRECLAGVIKFSETPLVKCVFRNDEYSCECHLQEREVRALVTPEVYERHLQRSLALAESQAQDSFHCKTPDCPGWCLFEDDVNTFLCPVCKHTNCLTCDAIHEGKNCQQYQDDLSSRSDSNKEARKTKKYLQNMLDNGKAKKCPKCQVIIVKKGGCSLMTCSMCRTGFFWDTLLPLPNLLRPNLPLSIPPLPNLPLFAGLANYYEPGGLRSTPVVDAPPHHWWWM